MTFVPANHPFIQYVGRWDLGDSSLARHSWPGVFLVARFTGRKIGVRMDDATNYYNVEIDGALQRVFHGTKEGTVDYFLADSLSEGEHTLRFSKRNIVFDRVFTFSGLLLDAGATLLPPPPRPPRRIEFIGDSFTAAESNEATADQLAWEERFPVTNIDRGFAPLIARHFNAEYHTTCRSGSGVVCDWQGKREVAIPAIFDRTLMEAPVPKWDFSRWVPDVAVITLGLNDLSGLKGTNGEVPDENSVLFRSCYRAFLRTVRSVYPGVTIFLVAAPREWIRLNVRRIVREEQADGHQDVHYLAFDDFPGGYVANGHPTVETHRKIAAQIIAGMEAAHAFTGTAQPR